MAQPFWEGLGLGTLLGALLNEVGKQVFGAAMKRRSEKAESVRKLLREDVSALQSRIDPLVKLSLDYYAKPSHEASAIAQQLRAELKRFANDWSILNRRLKENSQELLPASPLVRIRQAMTRQLDVTRADALAANDPLISEISGAALALQDELSQVKYRSV